ncbi:uncharacterized protein (DUF983 family) [Pedobacter cryoconitis]|uniref:Uncharacterized protein (DUF983 family) n=1 Tax=Pedobacter cryoconitis TaxID=188932 RepID=A0A7W8ZN25_9SPHI|nr:DUF983 domain-containing protein [Pedobacter cryoconitis]MBB5637016.1 uncharacterized protein (DUF983 family) [Pedobacter cryoconitis]MBB6271418.1 uncharacterized protein (DUF983 family) [Pedobacter cryoconitis]
MVPITKLEAVIQCKCPRCRQGNIFSGKMYSFSFKGQVTNEYCPHCNLRFEREPGFFYVSMFISYAMNVAEMISASVATYVLGLPLVYDNLWYYVGILLLTVFICSPFNYRYSRVMLLHWLTPGLGYIPGSGDEPGNFIKPA